MVHYLPLIVHIYTFYTLIFLIYSCSCVSNRVSHVRQASWCMLQRFMQVIEIARLTLLSPVISP